MPKRMEKPAIKPTQRLQSSSKARPTAFSYMRLSSALQLEGDSLRRQTDLSIEYAEKHNLELDLSLSFQDLGVSGYRGSHLEKGLGLFLDAINQGKVKEGSYLLIENLDRLSRQNAFRAFSIFANILSHGIQVVTLHDEKVYSGELSFPDLMMTIVAMQRSHDESRAKEIRSKQNWKHKRELARSGVKKFTAMTPGWIRLDKETDTFHIIEDRAALVRRMFSMTLDGHGRRSIARAFNREGHLSFNNKVWRGSTIDKILKSPAVVGELQLHKDDRTTGIRRRIYTETLENYYPAIIEKADFYKVQQMKNDRIIPTGRGGIKFSNVLTGLCYCGACGAKMHYENKGHKRNQYLVCGNARVHAKDCSRHSWRYGEALCHIFWNLSEIDYRQIIPSIQKKGASIKDQLETDITTTQGELEAVTQKVDRLVELMIDREDNKTLLQKFDKMDSQKSELESKLKGLEGRFKKEANRLEVAPRYYSEMLEAVEVFVKIERSGNLKAILEVRRRFHQLLKNVIEKIVFTPVSLLPTENDTLHGTLHGSIEIHFKGVEDYHRLIKVEKVQHISSGYTVTDGKDGVKTEHAIDVMGASWPPEGIYFPTEGDRPLIFSENADANE